MALAAVVLPLSCLGFWLSCACVLHEPEEASGYRAKLADDNAFLQDNLKPLGERVDQARARLDQLEGQKVNALLLSGLDYAEEGARKRNRLFSFFADLAPMQVDAGRSLERARGVSVYLDTVLALLQSNPGLRDGLPVARPVADTAILARGFGPSLDPFTGRKGLHEGLDFSDREGAPVFASGGGMVAAAGRDETWGLYVRIAHGRGAQTFYAHLRDLAVRPGQKVARGERIGSLGATGRATGPHLHYELLVGGEKVDPARFFLRPPAAPRAAGERMAAVP